MSCFRKFEIIYVLVVIVVSECERRVYFLCPFSLDCKV